MPLVDPYNKYPYGTKEYWIQEVWNLRSDYHEYAAMGDTFAKDEARDALGHAKDEARRLGADDTDIYGGKETHV